MPRSGVATSPPGFGPLHQVASGANHRLMPLDQTSDHVEGLGRTLLLGDRGELGELAVAARRRGVDPEERESFRFPQEFPSILRFATFSLRPTVLPPGT